MNFLCPFSGANCLSLPEGNGHYNTKYQLFSTYSSLLIPINQLYSSHLQWDGNLGVLKQRSHHIFGAPPGRVLTPYTDNQDDLGRTFEHYSRAFNSHNSKASNASLVVSSFDLWLHDSSMFTYFHPVSESHPKKGQKKLMNQETIGNPVHAASCFSANGLEKNTQFPSGNST